MTCISAKTEDPKNANWKIETENIRCKTIFDYEGTIMMFKKKDLKSKG